MFSLPSNARLATAVTAIVGVMGLASVPAHALVANVRGIDYNIDTVFGTFAANETLLIGQEWWNDPALASDFAAALTDQLGLNAFGDGPFFAFQKVPETDPSYNPLFTISLKTWNEATTNVNTGGTPSGIFQSVSYEWTYATATRAPSVPSVPGPLPIFGAVAAFGYSRRLRNRIQGVKKSPDVFHFQ
jgi:hypothetical protein